MARIFFRRGRVLPHMPTESFPTSDQELEAFLTEFLANIGPILLALSLAATVDDDLVAKKATYSAKLATNIATQAQARADRQAKDDSKNATIASLRVLIKLLEAHGLTAQQRADLGLGPKDDTLTPIVPGQEVPSGEVDTSAPQRHGISFWQMTDQQGERIAKPDWARACRIMYAIVPTGAGAPGVETMTFLASDTSSPYYWDIPASHVGKDVWYRLAWETPRGALGPWSMPIKGTVTG